LFCGAAGAQNPAAGSRARGSQEFALRAGAGPGRRTPLPVRGNHPVPRQCAGPPALLVPTLVAFWARPAAEPEPRPRSRIDRATWPLGGRGSEPRCRIEGTIARGSCARGLRHFLVLPSLPFGLARQRNLSPGLVLASHGPGLGFGIARTPASFGVGLERSRSCFEPRFDSSFWG